MSKLNEEIINYQNNEICFMEILSGGNNDVTRTRISELTEELIRTTGKGFVLNGLELSGYNLQGVDLRKAVLNQAQLYGTNLSNANLAGASLICPGLERTNFSGANLSGAYLHALGAQVCNFSKANLSDVVDATGSLFHGCNLSGATFTNGVFSGTTFYQCMLENTDLSTSNLQGCTFNECFMDDASFIGALVSQLSITKCHLTRTRFDYVSGTGLVLQRLTSFDNVSMVQAKTPSLRIDNVCGSNLNAQNLYAPNGDFIDSSVHNANLENSELSYSRWKSCNFNGANLLSAKLEASSIINCSMIGVTLRGALAENINVVETNMAHSDLTRFSGRCSTFRDCDLSESLMVGVYMYRAMITGDPPKSMSLRGVNLEGANFVQAYIAADLSQANLRSVNFVYARINQSLFNESVLFGVNMYQSSMVKTDFRGAQIVGIKSPFFCDRCPGLEQSVKASNRAEEVEDVIQWITALNQLVKDAGGSST
jgi:uncharacterized protein YjbI with pentapeptide repeats